MDPERRSGGYTRSLVVASQPATGSDPAAAAGPFEYILPAGPVPRRTRSPTARCRGRPRSRAAPSRASEVQLALPVEVPPGVTLGPAYPLGARWIPLDVVAAPAEGGPDAASGLVAPESAAALVEVVAAEIRDAVVTAQARLPPVPGQYRLEVTLHDGDAVALPYAVSAGT